MYDIIKTLTDYRRVNMIKKLLSMMNIRKLLKWFFKILPCAIYAKALKKLPIDNKYFWKHSTAEKSAVIFSTF